MFTTLAGLAMLGATLIDIDQGPIKIFYDQRRSSANRTGRYLIVKRWRSGGRVDVIAQRDSLSDAKTAADNWSTGCYEDRLVPNRSDCTVDILDTATGSLLQSWRTGKAVYVRGKNINRTKIVGPYAARAKK